MRAPFRFSTAGNLFLITLGAFAGGCSPVEQAPLVPSGRGGREVQVRAGQEGEAGNLRIGLGFVNATSPVTVDGRNRSLEAGLWIYVRGDPSKNTRAAVRAGQSLRVGDTDLFVEEVRGGSGASVRLALSEKRAAPGK